MTADDRGDQNTRRRDCVDIAAIIRRRAVRMQDLRTALEVVAADRGVELRPLIDQLNGVVNQHKADQGLLVAWDGLTGPARDAMRNMQLRIALWESTDVVRKLLGVYDRLPVHITARIPLRQVWMLAPWTLIVRLRSVQGAAGLT